LIHGFDRVKAFFQTLNHYYQQIVFKTIEVIRNNYLDQYEKHYQKANNENETVTHHSENIRDIKGECFVSILKLLTTLLETYHLIFLLEQNINLTEQILELYTEYIDYNSGVRHVSYHLSKFIQKFLCSNIASITLYHDYNQVYTNENVSNNEEDSEDLKTYYEEMYKEILAFLMREL
jgi:hypothetical protein